MGNDGTHRLVDALFQFLSRTQRVRVHADASFATATTVPSILLCCITIIFDIFNVTHTYMVAYNQAVTPALPSVPQHISHCGRNMYITVLCTPRCLRMTTHIRAGSTTPRSSVGRCTVLDIVAKYIFHLLFIWSMYSVKDPLHYYGFKY